MGDVVAGHAVVIAEIPLAFIFYDVVVGGPSYSGIENDTLIGERSVGIVTNGIAEEVAVARGVGEIILAVVFEFLQQPYMQRKMLRIGNIILKKRCLCATFLLFLHR